MTRIPGHVLVLVVGLSLTLAAAIWSYSQSDRRDRSRLERRADLVETSINASLATRIVLIRSADAAIRANGYPTQREFRRYVSRLDLGSAYPGLQGLGFAIFLGNGPTAAAERRIARLGYDAALWPGHEREQYSAIVLLEPQDARNRAAIGFDMLSEPTRRAAMLNAAASDEPVITRPLILVQEITEDVQPGFLIYVPTRSSSGALIGWTYAPFRARDFFGAILEQERFDAEVCVQGNGAELHRTPDWHTEGLRSVRTIDAAGAGWTVRVAFPATYRREREWALIGALGLVFTLPFAGFMRWHSRYRLKLAIALEEAERAREANELLLDEVHHRVGNSLSLVSSLLSLQQRTLDDPQAKLALQTASNRIAAIAGVHRDLHLSGGSTTVSTSRFLGALIESMRAQLQTGADGVEIKSEIAERQLTADKAIPLGIVASELVTNAVKYAFPSGKGAIDVSLRAEPGRLVLTVADDGAGITEGVKGSGLGTRIVEAMARQLHGEFVRSSGPRGTSTVFWFPLETAKRGGTDDSAGGAAPAGRPV